MKVYKVIKMQQVAELTELKRIRELLEFQALGPLEQRLDKVIGNNKDKRIIWILSDGKIPFAEIVPRLSVKRAMAYNYLVEMKYHNLIKDHNGSPMRIVDYIPGTWGDPEKILSSTTNKEKTEAQFDGSASEKTEDTSV